MAYWLPRLEDRIANGGSPKHGATWLHPSSPPNLGFSVNGRQQPFRGQHHLLPQSCTSGPSTSPPSSQGTSLGPGFSNGYHPRVRRSNSLTPPVSIPNSADLWSSQSSLASSGSGSESHLDEYRAAGSAVVAGTTKMSCSNTEQDSTIMRDIAAWLKSLRLHKYASLFARLSYEEMLCLTEEKLAAEGVTKGARHKIVLSIRKLQDRAATLKYLGEEVSRGKSIRYALEELKSIASTPMKESKEGEKTEGEDDEDTDIPQLFTQVMGKGLLQSHFSIFWIVNGMSKFFKSLL
ncbi:hypothetical protein J437_LFUL018136 [Ladona fulva]|uniref:SAM domain-containing protein n=1 Tax=Ladona fulva TaxID=123851 RepID=A0A8K0NW01_LADFU|nr:hypothetical protein J437_LFUL018136 [Ladona fulva]